MSTYNVGEFGQTLYINMKQDISTTSNYKVMLEPRSGELKEFTTNISVGLSNVIVDDQKYYGGEYLEYVFQDGDLDQSGLWRYRGNTTLSGGSLIKSDYVLMTILP